MRKQQPEGSEPAGIEPGTVRLNDLVTWLDCPQREFRTARVTGISPDGKQLLIGFIRHPVPVERCEWCCDLEARKFWRHYKDLTENQWPNDAS